jgi:TDG/mug DNA glycosylase family protein
VSLARAQYYAHPQNQFWRLIGAVIGTDLVSLDYERRLAALLAARIGLWDVVRSATRAGSLDTAIRDHEPNALGDFAATLPALRAIAFNGGKASEIGRRALGDGGGLALIRLPSSSPAHTMAFETKKAAWMGLAEFVGRPTDPSSK